MTAQYYYNRSNKSRIDSSSKIEDSLFKDLIQITELEYILLGLVGKYPSSTFTKALSKAYNLLDNVDSESKDD